jgi:hypothetical protein
MVLDPDYCPLTLFIARDSAGDNLLIMHPSPSRIQGSGPETRPPADGVRALSEMGPVGAMNAVAALYAQGEQELSEAIIASLSRAVFEGPHPAPASLVKRTFARLSYRVLKWTTSPRKAANDGYKGGAFHNPLLEWSGHPYARALLDSSCTETESLVEGGDPMNGPYMLICPEIHRASAIWDRIFMDSVQSRDVQLRFIWETRASYEAARARLQAGTDVRMKAVAAGTGLSKILVYDRLLKDGFDPARITVRITDRDEAGLAKARRLLAKLPSTRNRVTETETDGGISVGVEDLFATDPAPGGAPEKKYHVLTAVGILDYLPGFTCETTERSQRLEQPEETVNAQHLATKLAQMAADGAALVVNTYHPDASTRILELFGRKFDYRKLEDLTALLATAGFGSPRVAGSGNVYDVVVFRRGE